MTLEQPRLDSDPPNGSDRERGATPNVAHSLLTLSKDQMWIIACWHFQKTKLVVSLLALSKGQTCGSEPTDTFKRPYVIHSLLALSKDQTCGFKPAGTFKRPDLWLEAC